MYVEAWFELSFGGLIESVSPEPLQLVRLYNLTRWKKPLGLNKAANLKNVEASSIFDCEEEFLENRGHAKPVSCRWARPAADLTSIYIRADNIFNSLSGQVVVAGCFRWKSTAGRIKVFRRLLCLSGERTCMEANWKPLANPSAFVLYSMQEAFRRLPIFFSLLGARYSQSVLNQQKKNNQGKGDDGPTAKTDRRWRSTCRLNCGWKAAKPSAHDDITSVRP